MVTNLTGKRKCFVSDLPNTANGRLRTETVAMHWRLPRLLQWPRPGRRDKRGMRQQPQKGHRRCSHGSLTERQHVRRTQHPAASLRILLRFKQRRKQRSGKCRIQQTFCRRSRKRNVGSWEKVYAVPGI